MKINSVCICGAGTMGNGIAQVTASAGYKTTLYELNATVLDRAKQTITSNLSFLVSKGKITEAEKTEIFKRIKFTSNVIDCIADIVVEAIIEKPEAKSSLFASLASINNKASIFASNTSSLSITALASKIPGPERFAGLHFFNPAPLMKLVEVVKGRQTSDEVVNELTSFTKSLGKIAVFCKDAPGFIVNRVARPYYIESLRLLEEGYATIEIIERLMEDRGFKMGPFRLMDLIGNDINYAVSCSVYDQLEKPERLKPSDIQKQKVETGALGKKSGKGYYSYQTPEKI
jgi:3-hydroxybutyryl-CoA dehydrogenase